MKIFKFFTAVLLLCSGISAMADMESYLAEIYSEQEKVIREMNTLVAAGTQGQISEVKSLGSDQYAMRVNVTSGANKGQQVWLPYNSLNPQLTLYSSQQAMQNNQATNFLGQASWLMTQSALQGYRAPANPAVTSTKARELMNRAHNLNSSLKEFGQPGNDCDQCELKKQYARDTSDNQDIQLKTDNPHGILPSICRFSPDSSYEHCTYEGYDNVGRVKVTSRGPNRIVSAGHKRDWSFEAPGNATQDMLIKLSDYKLNGSLRSGNESYFMVFPRTNIPSISIEGSKRVVTLPNGEKAIFDGNNGNNVIGGVFSETGKAQTFPAKVSYQGGGVSLRVDMVGDDPRLAKGKHTLAVISKKGHKDCKVPKKELWPDQSEKSALHFKYASDSAFESFLQKRCGFGL